MCCHLHIWGYWYFYQKSLLQLCFLQPSISHDVLCIKVKQAGWQIQSWCIAFPIWKQSIVCPVLTVSSWPAYTFLRKQVRWSGIPISFRIFHNLSKHSVFSIVNKAEVDVFLEFFSYDPTDVSNLISGFSAFLNPVWTSGSSQFMYCWSLFWRILSIILLAKWVQLCGHLSILWHCFLRGWNES